MSHDIPRLRLTSRRDDSTVIEGDAAMFEGAAAVHEGLLICFYMPHVHPKLAARVWEAFKVFRRSTGPSALRTIYSPEWEDWVELDASGWRRLREELLDKQRPAGRLEIVERGSPQDDYWFEYMGNVRTQGSEDNPYALNDVHCRLPTEYLNRHGPARLRKLALEMASLLPFSYGYVSPALFSSNEGHTPYFVGRYLLRYPGFDWPRTSTLSWWMGMDRRDDKLATGVHWLNFLGPELMRRLGGVRALRKQLTSPGTTVQALPDKGALVSLGEWPEVGDMQERRVLPAYRELARVLEPNLYVLVPTWPEDWHEAWLWRFLAPLPWEGPPSPDAPWRHRNQRPPRRGQLVEEPPRD